MAWRSVGLWFPIVLRPLTGEKQKSPLELKDLGKSESSKTPVYPDDVKVNLETSLGPGKPLDLMARGKAVLPLACHSTDRRTLQ